MNRKDKELTILEFSKVKNYGIFAILSILFGILLALLSFIRFEKITPGVIIIILSLLLFKYFVKNFKCPDCERNLFLSGPLKKIKACPKCQATLRK